MLRHTLMSLPLMLLVTTTPDYRFFAYAAAITPTAAHAIYVIDAAT